MSKINIDILKSKFETGDVPTGEDFVSLIDTLSDLSDIAVETARASAAEITLQSNIDAKENAGIANSLLVNHLSSFNHSNITHSNRAALDAVIGVNTGDQDLSGYATTANVDLGLSSKVDNSTFITSLAAKADTSAVNVLLASKADKLNTYTISATDKLIAAKADINDPIFTGTAEFTGNVSAIGDIYISGDILPTSNSTQDIGSSDNRFKTIYVDEARLSTNTLYLGDTPVLGTTQDTIMIKADTGQSINISTTGVGSTLLSSVKNISLETSGINADVIVQATGSGSKVRFGATNGVEFSSATYALSDFSTSGNQSVGGNLTVTGNLTVNGAQTIVNSTTVTTKDNIVVVNQGEVGDGVTATYAGIQVDRGELTDYRLVFNESIDMFQMGAIGSLETIASQDFVNNQVDTINTALNTKAPQSTTYTKTEVDVLLAFKAPQSTTYSITQVDALLTNKASITYVDSTKSTILGQTMPNTYGVTRVFSQMTTPTANAVGDLWIDLSAN